MKCTSIFIVFLSTVILSNAQPILTSQGINPTKSGNYYEMPLVNPIAPLDSGANKTWNLNSLKFNYDPFSGYYNLSCFPIGTFSGTALFLDANVSIKGWAYNPLDMYIADSSSFSYVGYVPAKPSYGPPLHYLKKKTILPFPFTYQSKFIDSCTHSFTDVNNLSYELDTIVGDAYGTLIMSDATYTNILRVKYNARNIQLVNGAISKSVLTTSYYYYANGYYRPILFFENDSIGKTKNGYYINSAKLPLAIHDLTVSRLQQKPLVRWKAENTTNTTGFNILRSTDGVHFKKAAFLPVTKTISDYQFIDNIIPSNKVYYKIEQLDNNGALFYSNTVVLKSEITDLVYKVFPNPAKNFIQLLGTIGGTTHIEIYTLGGILMYDNKNYQSTQQISISNWGKGQYFIHLETANGTEVTSFEKL